MSSIRDSWERNGVLCFAKSRSIPQTLKHLLLCNQHSFGSAAKAGRGLLANSRLIRGQEWMLSPRKDRQ